MISMYVLIYLKKALYICNIQTRFLMVQKTTASQGAPLRWLAARIPGGTWSTKSCNVTWAWNSWDFWKRHETLMIHTPCASLLFHGFCRICLFNLGITLGWLTTNDFLSWRAWCSAMLPPRFEAVPRRRSLQSSIPAALDIVSVWPWPAAPVSDVTRAVIPMPFVWKVIGGLVAAATNRGHESCKTQKQHFTVYACILVRLFERSHSLKCVAVVFLGTCHSTCATEEEDLASQSLFASLAPITRVAS